MGQEGNTPVWRIFEGQLSVNDVESGTFTALQRNTAYNVVKDDIEAGEAIFTVEYIGNMNAGNYTVAYTENNIDECFKTEILQIEMQESFNVDVALVSEDDAGRCPDLSGSPQNPGFADYRTIIPYRLTLETPDVAVGYVDEWSFNYNITVTSNGGSTDATVHSVEVDYNEDGGIDDTDTPSGSVSFYSQSVVVPNQNPDPVANVILYIYINDVLGEAQNVEVEITGIEGSYLEVDGNSEGNTAQNGIWSMPDVGSISSLN
jgi:hypothetical protein